MVNILYNIAYLCDLSIFLTAFGAHFCFIIRCIQLLYITVYCCIYRVYKCILCLYSPSWTRTSLFHFHPMFLDTLTCISMYTNVYSPFLDFSKTYVSIFSLHCPVHLFHCRLTGKERILDFMALSKCKGRKDGV